MPLVTPNFEDAPQRPPLKPGKYRATIKKVEEKTSKNNNPYLNWVFETDVDRQWAYLSTAYSGKGAQIFRKVIQASLSPSYQNGPVNTDDCLGKVVMITIEPSQGQNGNTYYNVTDIEADDEAFDAFAAG